MTSYKMMNRFKNILLFTFFIFLINGTVKAQVIDTLPNTQASNDPISNLFALSFDELLNLKISSATKFDESIKESPSSVFIISKKEIQTYGYRTLAEALQHVPGFYVLDDHTFYKENFGVRGFYRDEWNQNIIFLVNGVRQRSTYDHNNKLAYINVPIQAIEKIEVIKGPNSITYGTGAFFGVVNIITTQNNDSNSEVYTSYGSQNTLNAGVNVNESINDINLNFIAGIQNTDGINQNYKDMGLDSSFMSENYMKENQKYFALNIKKGSIYANINLDQNNSIRPVIVAPGSSDIYENKGEFIAHRSAVGINHSFNDKLTINSSYQFQFQQELLTLDFAGVDFDQETQLSKIESHEIDFHLKYNISDRFNTTIGGNFINTPTLTDNVDAPLAGIPNTTNSLYTTPKMWGIYFRAKYQFNKKLNIRAGIRIDEALEYTVVRDRNLGVQYTDPDTLLGSTYSQKLINFRNNGTTVLPEAAIVYQLQKNHTLKLIYGTAINRLSIFRAGSSEKGIKPENISSLELNHLATLNKKLQINTSILYNYLFNLVQTDFSIKDGKQSQNTTNNGEFTTFGIETSLDYRPTNKLRFYISGNYYKTTDKTYPETTADFSPQFLGYLNISYQLKDFTFAITNHYTATMEAEFNHKLEDPTDLNSNEIGREGEASPAYLNTGLNIRYTPSFMDGLYANLRVSNLFNQKMYYPVGEFNDWATNGTLGINRTVLATVGYSF